jgi:hypothetical protein
MRDLVALADPRDVLRTRRGGIMAREMDAQVHATSQGGRPYVWSAPPGYPPLMDGAGLQACRTWGTEGMVGRGARGRRGQDDAPS